ncbi:MAG: hypothetical protein K6V97_11405 [Actinomycetia bacterium]|nr:hypothetical protein [Actinomycetes bacterium]
MYVFICPRCGFVRQGGRRDLPTITVDEICYNCAKREPAPRPASPTEITKYLTGLDSEHGGHGALRHGSWTDLNWHKDRLPTTRLFASTKYADPETQLQALRDIMHTVRSSPRLREMMEAGMPFVIVVEHGVPVDEGWWMDRDGPKPIRGLTRSKAVFRAGQYQHPYTYFPTPQEATDL